MARYNPNLMQLDEGDTGAPVRRANIPVTPVSDTELAVENAKFDPATGMPLELLKSDIPEIRQSFTKPGFNPGPFPTEYEKFFGKPDPNMLGWRIVTNADGSQQLEVQDSPNSSFTYGADISGRKPSPTPTPTPTPTQSVATATAAAVAAQAAADKAAKAAQERQSIIAVLQDRFAKYGLSGLANKIKELAIDGATEATITLGLQATDEYRMRFKANEVRIKNGLSVLQPAEYLNLEDGYRQVLRAYGLKAFDNDEYVQQFIANDVSAAELSNRVVTAVQRVQNADPAVAKQLRDFYGIGSADLVAYVLDPQQQFQKIERQVAASEIGVAAGRQGLNVGVGVAEQLAAQGVSMAEAQKGYATIADILPTAEKLSAIYGETTGVTYGQSEAEQEVFNSLASAQRARQKLTSLEVAQFGGQSGLSKAALTTQNKGNF